MTQAEFGNYLLCTAILLGILGIVNLIRPHKRWLGVGSICLGFAAVLYRQGVPVMVVYVAGGLGVLCMVRDVAGRSGKSGAKA